MSTEIGHNHDGIAKRRASPPYRLVRSWSDLAELIVFLGDSLARLRDFPPDARAEAGQQLREVQQGNDPTDWCFTLSARKRSRRNKGTLK